jgi:hypothetical protein
MVLCWVLHALLTTRWLSCISSHLQYNANLEARMKYAEQPDKFMESEADLDEAVKAMLVVASAPDLYPEFVRRSDVAFGRVNDPGHHLCFDPSTCHLHSVINLWAPHFAGCAAGSYAARQQYPRSWHC